MRIAKIAALCIAVILAFSFAKSCAREGTSGSAGGPVRIGNEAPDFTLQKVNGGKIGLKSFRGKPVLLVFGATWCGYCVQEVPDLNKLHADYSRKGLVILNVDIDESQAKVASFVKKKGIKYRVVLDKGGKVAQVYGVRGIPTNILIDKEGIMRYKNHPMPDRSEIDRLL